MKVKETIYAKGFTIGTLAEKMGTSASGLSQKVNNPNTPISTLRDIAEAIGCKVGDFFLDETSECFKAFVWNGYEMKEYDSRDELLRAII